MLYLNFTSDISAITPIIQSTSLGETGVWLNSFSCDFSGSLTFGNIPTDSLVNFYKDGRHSSPILSWWLAENANLTHVFDGNNSHFLDDKSNRFRLKTFAKGAMNFRPSKQQGVSRVHNEQEVQDFASKHTFIVADVSSFPVVQFKLVTGQFLLDTFPNKKSVPFKSKHLIFDSAPP